MITQSTKNGWYSVRLRDATVVKVRGKCNIECSPTESSRTESSRTESSRTECRADVQLYSKDSRLTKSQTAAIRRDCVLSRLAKEQLPKVMKENIKIVVSNKRGELEYQCLCEKKSVKATRGELDSLLESEHFEKAWTHVTHRDSSRLWGVDQFTPHVIYMAVMTFGSNLETRRDDGNRVLVHSTNDQAYIGLAKHGVAHRWGGYQYNHIRSANEASKASASSKPTLVDATMRLHCANGGTVWLFVVQHNLNLPLRSEEQRLIHYFGTHGEHGMNATK